MILSFLLALGVLYMTVAFAARVIGALFSAKSRILVRENKAWHFVWFLASAAVICFLSIGTICGPRIPSARVQAFKAVSSLKQLHLSIQQYNLDIITNDDKASHLYPSSLRDLVTSDYLSEVDFNRLTAGLPIAYYQPTSSATGAFLVLEVSTADYYAAITLDGTTQFQVYKKTKTSEQADALNSHAFGTFVTHPADAGSAPKASGSK
jgi:hypothetical protein